MIINHHAIFKVFIPFWKNDLKIAPVKFKKYLQNKGKRFKMQLNKSCSKVQVFKIHILKLGNNPF